MAEGGLRIAGLDVRYGKSHVVFGVDLEVRRGEVVALLGRNGAGKTTTLLGITGLLPGASGQIEIDGDDVSRWPTHRRARAGIAYVPSGARCFADLTVTENLEIAARGAGESGWTLARVFGVFPKLEELRRNLAGGLSGGERQMLAAGRALMSNPGVMLLDEPTEGLAPVIVQRLGDLVREVRDSGVGILIAEQNHQMALRVADRAAFMEKGRVVEQMDARAARGSEVLHRILGI